MHFINLVKRSSGCVGSAAFECRVSGPPRLYRQKGQILCRKPHERREYIILHAVVGGNPVYGQIPIIIIIIIWSLKLSIGNTLLRLLLVIAIRNGQRPTGPIQLGIMLYSDRNRFVGQLNYARRSSPTCGVDTFSALTRNYRYFLINNIRGD